MPIVLDLSAFKKAIQSLREALDVVRNTHWFYAQSDAVQNTLIAGVIQNVEFVYELSIKMLRRQLEQEAANPVEIDAASFKDLLRIAAEKSLIQDIERWFGYRAMRNITSHAYDHEKAEQVYRDTLCFIDDAVLLLNQLEKRNVANT